MKLSVAQIKRVTRDTIYISIHVTFYITPSKATCRELNFKFISAFLIFVYKKHSH